MSMLTDFTTSHVLNVQDINKQQQQYSTIQYILYITVKFNLLYSTVQYITVGSVLYITVEYITVHYCTIYYCREHSGRAVSTSVLSHHLSGVTPTDSFLSV